VTGADAPTDGIEEWVELVDQALQGVHHALNNRIGSLSAMVELHQLGDVPAGRSTFESLTADLARLADCNRMLRLLPRDSVAGEEPLILDDVLADVFAIHRYLHDARDLQVTAAPTRYVEPVRVERWALVRVLTMLLRDAKRVAKETGSAIRAVTESDDQWVRVEFRVGTAPVSDVVTSGGGRYAELLAESFGGKLDRRAGVAELRLPTLKARRAADRR
jgi:hypothetical protein